MRRGLMATDIGRLMVPDVQNTVPIEWMVASLRKDISSECSGLLRRTRSTSLARATSAPRRIRLWERRISNIIGANASTYSIEELRRLRRECRALSEEMGRFEA